MIYVMRHGETNLNKERKIQGRIGLPLNEIGIMQAEKMREQLKNIEFDYVFSSPQERAIQTADIATGLKVVIDPRLDVFNLGEADGLKANEVKMNGIVPDSNFYQGVEDPSSFVRRVFSFMSELEDNYRNKKLNILISGHRCTTGCIGAYFKGIPTDGNIKKLSSDTGDYKVYEF